MTTLIVLLFLISNSAWILACLVLMFSQEQINSWIAWTQWQITFDPAGFVPHLLLIAFAAQLILLCLIYLIRERGAYLSRRNKKMREERKELLGKNKDAEKQLNEHAKALEAAGSVEEQNNILNERVQGLENLNAELRGQNETFNRENDELQEQVQRLEEEKQKLKDGKPLSFVDQVKGWFTRKP